MNKRILLVVATVLSAAPAFAQEAMASAAGISDKGLFAIGAGIALGIAALGGALAQGRIGTAAMDGIARNPQAASSMQTPMILGLVFVETLVLFTFLIAFMLQGKI
jgi:F-type H+-transporting ATPase subunit c